ncbi:tetratricopeptide (TPR) repeat protein [Streptomyces sp. PvR006]|uniref:hypothetical protein n=1 Tax=Streptomyces sp. PvR006 TaxID=2817860 RepID=UPI001AE29797|nr:hypothetical protein [Streptomyces sp. PvR006]MBP2580552.1 tetratricopeptide (TPR) repeat protein [Streptomyces sp. PvR006]
MSSRSPDEFRLGVRPYDRGAGTGDEPEDPHELLHRARRLTVHGHPGAGSAWERAATALRRAGGVLTPGDHADALDATALDCRGAARPAAGPLFFRAADLHERAGQRGKALVSRARALVAGPGPGATACARLGELCERASALHRVGQAGVAETATVRLLHGRVRADLLGTAPDPAAEAAALREDLARLVAFAAPHRADPAVARVLADTRALLGRITAPDDPAAAEAQLRAALDDHRAGGRTWPATGHHLLLSAVLRATGAHEEAAAVLRAALVPPVTDTPLRAADRARLCLALARTVEGSGEQGRTARGAEKASEAAETAEALEGEPERTAGEPEEPAREPAREPERTAGEPEEPAREPEETAQEDGERFALLAEAVRHTEGPARDVRVGSLARLLLGVAHAERGGWDRALALLEQALPGFQDDGDTAGRVRTRAWLAECLLHLGEPGRAAREYALAAAAARPWGDPRPGAALSRRAEHVLRLAGTRGPVPEIPGTGGTVYADAKAGTEASAEGGAPDGGARGAWPGLRELPEPFGPPGRYQVDVYGEVGGAWPQAATAPGTRVQGCE